MQDRVPLYPGRVKLVPVAGQKNTYDMTRADQPTQEGDPLNKATLWSDVTAALFGLGVDSVPDDGFAYLGSTRSIGGNVEHRLASVNGNTCSLLIDIPTLTLESNTAMSTSIWESPLKTLCLPLVSSEERTQEQASAGMQTKIR